MYALVNPGQAYSTKFDAYAAQLSEGANPLIQVLTLLAALYVPVVPFTILFWSRLTPAIGVVAILGMALYASFYLYIGTLKGLGDLLIFGAVGAMVRQAQRPHPGRRAASGRRLLALGTIAVILFGGYMAYNQSQRLAVFNNQGSFEPIPSPRP